MKQLTAEQKEIVDLVLQALVDSMKHYGQHPAQDESAGIREASRAISADLELYFENFDRFDFRNKVNEAEPKPLDTKD